MSFLINLVIIAIAVVVGFWVLGIIAGALGLPLVAVQLLKVLIVLLAVGWLIDAFRGGRFTIIR